MKTDYKKANIKIGFIGAGKVGFSLGKFFSEKGISVTGYYSRNLISAQEAAQFTGSHPYLSIDGLIRDSDALFLTVPDGAIASIYQEFVRSYSNSDSKNGILSGKQICHCSGAMTAQEAFPDINQVSGAYGYSIHPLFPFSSKLESYRELPGAFFCIEGDGPHISDWQTLLLSLDLRVQILPAEKDSKARYHAACAISSNLICALIQESLDLLTSCGFSPDTALQALTPLIQSNLGHILQDGPVHALTGPVERCDTGTVKKHLDCLANLDLSVRERYRIVSQKLVELAQKKHPETNYFPMEMILKEGPET